MDTGKAKDLFENGAILLLFDFPSGSEFGIDYNSWTVGPNFKGVKMIPSGIHFIYYRFVLISSFNGTGMAGPHIDFFILLGFWLSSVNSSGQTSPRSGFFYSFSPKEIVVKKWDPQLEDISDDREPDSEELEQLHRNKRELDKFLGPYPYENYKQWVSLSSHITKETLSLLQPDCGFIYAATQFVSEPSDSRSRLLALAERKAETDPNSPSKSRTELPQMKNVEKTTIKYSTVPKKIPDGATPAEITRYSMDSTYAFKLLLSERFQNDSEFILGEIQFAFICFIVGQNYDSFEQWKRLVHLLCTSGDAALKYPNTFLSFISLLHFHIREIPSDFFVDIVTSNNFLTVTLHELFQNILNDDIDPKLRKRGISFKKHLTDKFKWDFTSEPDDCAPVIVEMG